jgi:hypothetical protein
MARAAPGNAAPDRRSATTTEQPAAPSAWVTARPTNPAAPLTKTGPDSGAVSVILSGFLFIGIDRYTE